MLDHVPYTVSNGFSKGLKSIYEVDLDQFAVDLHSFFSSQLKKSKNILMWKSSQKFMVSACRDTFPLDGSVLLRIMEQFINLREYFLKLLATRKGFNGKSVIAASERYIRIKNVT